MANQSELAETFHALHIKGNPVILYNIWDAGSAAAVAGSGAKAIASGSHGVANAFGFEDGELIPLEIALQNAERIVAATDLPVTMDVETGYGATAAEVAVSIEKIIATGVIGINIEDQIVGKSELWTVSEQSERIQAARSAAEAADVPLFINARTDIFKNAGDTPHDHLLDEAVERADAYRQAGADCLFVPGLTDIELIRTLCERSSLPINILRLPGLVSNKELAQANVARISYGVYPYLEMIAWLKQHAAETLTSLN